MSSTLRNYVAPVALATFCSSAAFAANSMSVSQELDAEYAYVGGARTRGAGLQATDIDENSADIKYVVSPQVTNDLLLRFGVEWQRFSFGVPNHTPVPDLLQQVSLVLGCDFQVADQWLMRAEVQPGIYSDFRDISGGDVDAPVIVGGAYLVNPDLQWFFGMRVDVRSHYPVVPAIGVRWKFADDWTLDFALPHPRLEFDLNEKVQLYLGADFEAGTFRLGDNFGTNRGQPKLDDAEVDFLEIRIGPGCSWKLTPHVTIDAEVGFMPYRDFDFSKSSIEYRSHNAPYGQIACHARF